VQFGPGPVHPTQNVIHPLYPKRPAYCRPDMWPLHLQFFTRAQVEFVGYGLHIFVSG
jgi:hypothetical protein